MRHLIKKRQLIVIAITLLSFQYSSAQPKFSVSGTIGFYADFYHLNADSAITPRRPSELYRFVCHSSFSFGAFSLPVNLNLSSFVPSVVSPVAKYRNFGEYLKNPLNQVGIAPKYKWVQLLLGTQVPHYSELSFGDQPVFGAGVRLTPGAFRLELFGGTSRQAIAEDTVAKIVGAYKRTMYSGKIGFGKEEGSHFYLIGGYAMDDIHSLKVAPVNTLPENGLLVSMDYRINMPEGFYAKGEVAGSMFSRDIRARVISDAPVTLPSDIFTARESTRTDGGAIFCIGKDGKSFGIKATGKYIGDGFVPLGYPFMQTDKLEVTIDPHFSLFKNKLIVSGGGGERINNLTHTRGSTATQVIGYANVSAQITDDFNLSGNFSNFGFRNTVQNDSFKIQMVTMSYGFSPSYTLTLGKTINMLSLSYNHDQFRDYNTVSGSLNDNDADCGILTYNISFSGNPLNVTLLLSSFSNKLSTGTVTLNSGGVTLGYSFWKNKLSVNVGETISSALLDHKNPASQLLTLVGAKVKILKNLSFSLNASLNNYDAGKTNPNYHFTEDLLRTSLIFKL